jgi:hypothetical protein
MSKTQTVPGSDTAIASQTDSTHDILDSSRSERIDTESLEKALSSLLALYPDAPAIALDSTGAVAPMPASVPLIRNSVLEAPAKEER